MEIGAGPASYRSFFKGCDVISTDLKMGPGIDEIADITRLKYKSETFDYVVCISVLEHVFEIKNAVSEMHRVLKIGGSAIVCVPFLYPLHDEPEDYYRFTEFLCRKLFQNFSRADIDTTLVLPFGIFKKFVLFYIVTAYK